MGELSDKCEWIEREGLRELCQYVPAMVKQSLGLRFDEVAGVACSGASINPSILINRCFGLGSRREATRDQIEQLKQWYAQYGANVVFLHVLPDAGPDTIEQDLQQAGFNKDRGWMKFTRDTLPPPAPAADFIVREIGASQARDFADIVTPAFDMDAAYQPLVESLALCPNWHLFMAFDGGRAAGTGALYARDGKGWYDWAATHPDFRRRGCQQVVLYHLINKARDLGCEFLATCTGEEVAGDPQHSYHNILRLGFHETYVRQNWSLS